MSYENELEKIKNHHLEHGSPINQNNNQQTSSDKQTSEEESEESKAQLRARKRRMKNLTANVIALSCVVAVIGSALSLTYSYLAADNVKIKITSTTVKRSGGTDKYLIFTDNLTTGQKEEFENTDSWLRFKFNSSSLQNKLNEPGIYNARVQGWRIPFWSMYRNIIDAEKLPDPKPIAAKPAQSAVRTEAAPCAKACPICVDPNISEAEVQMLSNVLNSTRQAVK